ncbi:MAG: MFS transporter [Treponema sp.]|nr:MFS transporter [Treponema sp.]
MEKNWGKNTALFLAGQALTLFGTMVVQYAILWHITLRSQSGTMMTIYTIVGLLPMFFISPFAGVWADRYNRKYIINIADGSIAFFSLIVAVLLMLGIESYIILFVCAFIRSIGQGIQTPAVGAFIPLIVPKEHLTRINGFQGSIQAFITIASPMLGGVLMTLAPLHTLFLLDVVTACIGISIVGFLVKIQKDYKIETEADETKGTSNEPERAKFPGTSNEPERAKFPGTSYFYELKEGFLYLKKHGYLLTLIIISALFLILFSPAALLTPLQVTRNFGADVWRLSAIEIIFSLGALAGGIIIGLWGGFKNRIYTMAFSCALCGLFAVGLGIVPSFWIYLVIMALLGISMPLYNRPAMALIQSTVDPNFMGRIISVFMMVSSTMMPIGMLIFGPLSDKISINIILVFTGIGVALLSILMITSKALLMAGMNEKKEEIENI